jgi:hypothetical protein
MSTAGKSANRSAPLRAGHRRRRERPTRHSAGLLVRERLDRLVADPRPEVGQVERGQRRRHRRHDFAAARRAPVVVLLAILHRAQTRGSRSPRPDRLNVLVAAVAARNRPVLQVRHRQRLVDEHPVAPVPRLRHPEELRVQEQHLVVVVDQIELLEPPPVRGAVTVLLARNRLAPRLQPRGALHQDHPRPVLGGVVQHAVRRRPVPLRLRDPRLEVRVIHPEQGQPCSYALVVFACEWLTQLTPATSRSAAGRSRAEW